MPSPIELSASLPLAVVTMTGWDWAVLIAYFGGVVWVGMWFGRFTSTTSDFFFGGSRFSWWLVAISCVATLVGSYSFVQYAQTGFKFGLCSMVPYTNEWFVLPLFLVAWLPIVYYNRIQSIPEYFERRFDRRTRMLVLVLMLIYLEGYISINLYTIGVFMNGLFGWPIVLSAALMAVVSGVYLHAGGQTSVIMTDLLQGFLLLAVGLGLFLAGIFYVGGAGTFWDGLPATHRLPFAGFNDSPQLNFVGDFWNDAVVGTFGFYFINQGVLMRFLSARSVRDGRRAMLLVVVVLMPLAAVAVSGAGWVGRAMLSAGQIAPTDNSPESMQTLSQNIFVTVADLVCVPGLFGLVIAAVVAALMSTLDTLITAVSAVAVNDIGRTLQPDREDSYYLKWARRVAVLATLTGLALVPLFSQFGSIYQALSHFTSMIVPPLVVVTVLASIWQRFSAWAAFWTLLLGSAAMLLSLVFPQVITPLAHGVSADEGYSFMRSLYGLVVCLGLALLLTWLDRTPAAAATPGLVITSLADAIHRFKGGPPNDRAAGAAIAARLVLAEGDDERVLLPRRMMERLGAEPGDLVHVSDTRWWLGGFRSLTAPIGEADESAAGLVLSSATLQRGHLHPHEPVRVEVLI